MKPTISIVIVQYNRTKLLRRSLLSIEAEITKIPYEIVIVNDGHNDQSLNNLAKEFSERLSGEIRIFNTNRTYEFRGPAFSINCAVKQAAGEYIIIQNPEQIHVGPVVDGMADLMSGVQKPYFCSRCMSLTEDDNQWLDEHESEWMRDTDILRRFDYPKRSEYIGRSRKRYLYFLAGMRREDYISTGGIDERFIYLGSEDKLFANMILHNGFDARVLFDAPFFALHQNHYRPTQLPLTKNRAEVRKMTRKVHKTLIDEIQRTKEPWIANQGKEWGVLPQG